jgi:hypothetical protein
MFAQNDRFHPQMWIFVVSHLTLLVVTTLTIILVFCEEYKMWTSPLSTTSWYTRPCPGIYLSQSSIRKTHIHPFIYIIAPGVPELCLSGVVYHRILHWPETHKFRYFTVIWHRTWSGRFTYLNTNRSMSVCTFQHNTHYRAVASIPICVNVTAAAIGNLGGGGVDPVEASHTIFPAENDA